MNNSAINTVVFWILFSIATTAFITLLILAFVISLPIEKPYTLSYILIIYQVFLLTYLCLVPITTKEYIILLGIFGFLVIMHGILLFWQLETILEISCHIYFIWFSITLMISILTFRNYGLFYSYTMDQGNQIILSALIRYYEDYITEVTNTLENNINQQITLLNTNKNNILEEKNTYDNYILGQDYYTSKIQPIQYDINTTTNNLSSALPQYLAILNGIVPDSTKNSKLELILLDSLPLMNNMTTVQKYTIFNGYSDQNIYGLIRYIEGNIEALDCTQIYRDLNNYAKMPLTLPLNDAIFKNFTIYFPQIMPGYYIINPYLIINQTQHRDQNICTIPPVLNTTLLTSTMIINSNNISVFQGDKKIIFNFIVNNKKHTLILQKWKFNNFLLYYIDGKLTWCLWKQYLHLFATNKLVGFNRTGGMFFLDIVNYNLLQGKISGYGRFMSPQIDLDIGKLNIDFNNNLTTMVKVLEEYTTLQARQEIDNNPINWTYDGKFINGKHSLFSFQIQGEESYNITLGYPFGIVSIGTDFITCQVKLLDNNQNIIIDNSIALN